MFTSDSRAELGGNMELVYNRMHERGLDKQFKIKMMFRESIKTRRKIGDKFKMPFVLGRADIIIVDDEINVKRTIKKGRTIYEA